MHIFTFKILYLEPYYFGKIPTLEAGILQNTDILLVMATIIEKWLYILILPLFADIPSFLALWTLRSALLGGNSFPIGYLLAAWGPGAG